MITDMMFTRSGAASIAGNMMISSPYPVEMTFQLKVCMAFLSGSVVLAMCVLAFHRFRGGVYFGVIMMTSYVLFIVISVGWHVYSSVAFDAESG